MSEEIKEIIEENNEAVQETAENDSDSVYRTDARVGYIGGIVVLVLTLVFYIAQYVINGTGNYGLCAAVFGMMTAEKFVRYAGLKRKRDLIFGILYTLFTICATVSFFVALLK